MVAGFLAMVWLLPFDAIELPVHLPLDAKLDRLLLILIGALWLSKLFSSHPYPRPRLRLGAVHLAVIGFMLVATIGTLHNATTLAGLGELSLSLKKLALLVSFALFFVIVASVVRPSEVSRFVDLLLGLATVAAIGTLFEYRFHYNPFYQWAQNVPLVDVLKPSDLDQRDSIGRISVYGPAGSPIENATMFALALPFALIGVIEAKTWRRRLLYLVVAALIVSAAMSTARKTSVIAPAAGLLVLLVYRHRALTRKLIPLLAAFVAMIHFLAPQAIGSLIQQLHPDQVTGVLSTRDRASDYDGVSPDILAHPLFGRGYKSFDPLTYRILDNEYLGLLVGVGIAEIIAYLALLLVAFRTAHRVARSDNPIWSPLAVAAASAIVVFALSTGLFDLLSFPHIPYAFFFVVALVVVCRDSLPSTSAGFTPVLGHDSSRWRSTNTPPKRISSPAKETRPRAVHCSRESYQSALFP